MPSSLTALTSPSENATAACAAKAGPRAGVSSRASGWTSSRSHSTKRWPPGSQRLARLRQAPKSAGLIV
eukprot:2253922-Alexandrium_andersonii.AAC.1